MRRAVTALGVYAFIGGIVSFSGWVFDLPRLTDWNASGISIQPNASLAIILASASLVLLARGHLRTATALAALVALVGGATLFEHLSGIDLGIDTPLRFGRTWGHRRITFAGRMGPPGAVSLVLMGVAMILASRPTMPAARRTAALVGLATASVSSLALIGYLYGAIALYSLPSTTAIALPMASFTFAISIGLMVVFSELEPVGLILDKGPAGSLVRRVAPGVIIVPIAIGYVRVLGEQNVPFDTTYGSALRTLVEIVLLLLLLWLTGNTIRREAARRAEAHVALKGSEQSLREADRRKDEFLAILAHELRNPLAPIRSAVELMKFDVPAETRLARCREVVDRQVSHMTRLLDDLLDAGRIAQGRLQLRTQTVEVATVIRMAVETCSPLIEKSGHELSISLLQEPIFLEADAVRLAQVFGNLLNNACKYTTPNGRVWVTATLDGSEVVVTVRDSGDGIPAVQLPRIFDMFSQRGAAADRSSGLGIGLHLVHSLVEMHNGTVTARSDGPGRGSEFIVRLPALVDRESAEVPNARASHESVPVRRVLVVDDNEDAASSLAMLLVAVGNEATVAQDGREALEKASAYDPDVILLDIGLPGMNGYEVCRTLRDKQGGRGPRIIALTGWGQDEDRRKSSAAGFDGHLVKPVSLEALQRALMESAA